MSRKFSDKLQTCFNKSACRFKNNQSGYIFILMCCLIPVILLGTKLVLDTMTANEVELSYRVYDNKPLKQRRAEKMALAVAENWNPGISLPQQKTALLKIADKVYEDNPISANEAHLLERAIPGIQLNVVDKVTPGKGYDPLKIQLKQAPEFIFSKVEYETKPKYLLKNMVVSPKTWNAPFMSWKIIDKATSDSAAYDQFDELDLDEYASGKYVLKHFDRYQSAYAKLETNAPTRIQFSSNDSELYCYTVSNLETDDVSSYTKTAKALSGKCTTAKSNDDGMYTVRKDSDYALVEVAVENDQIKITTDNEISGYAQPAECNIDIVLACPTNEEATTSESDVESTQIYQIGQAFRSFAKEFYHTKGVTMGLIPYSGKVSLSPDVAENYTCTYASRNNNKNFNSPDSAYLCSAVLYDSYGLKGGNLNTTYSWNTNLTACPIRYCGGVDRAYHGNNIFDGDILSTDQPSTAATKFFRQNSNPCRAIYANLLKNQCDNDCETYLPNPYYIIEPTADIQKIYEMCGALYPFYDKHNKSNFTFIPVNWAYNLWQSWTRDPKHVADTNNLSLPSKTDANRKKVLVLVVNKADNFEPRELTYLGFDDDYSEIPAFDGDCIDFTTDFSINTQKYADGTAHNGTIQGQKKFLKFSTTSGSVTYTNGSYQCTSGTGKLTFPKKGLIRVRVSTATSASGTIKFSDIISDMNTTSSSLYALEADEKREFFIESSRINGGSDGAYYITFEMSNIKLLSAEITNRPYEVFKGDVIFSTPVPSHSAYIDFSKKTDDAKLQYSTSNIFTYGSDNTGNILNTGIKWGDEVEITESDPEKWVSTEHAGKYHDICYDNGLFVAIGHDGNRNGAYSTDGINWSTCDMKTSVARWYVRYGRGKFIATINGDQHIAYSDNGKDWELKEMPKNICWTGLAYGDGKFVAIADGSKFGAYSADGITWKSMELPASRNWLGLCYGSDKFVAIAESQYGAYSYDGISWMECTFPVSGRWRAITYGNDKFVVVSQNSQIGAFSYDGINWESMYLPAVRSWEGLDHRAGRFLAIAAGNQSGAYSIDGVNWHNFQFPMSSNWISVAYGQGRFVAVGYDGRKIAYCDCNLEILDSGWRIYANSGSNSTNHKIFLKNPAGDMYFITDSRYHNFGIGNAYYQIGSLMEYLGGGLYKIALSGDVEYSWDLKNIAQEIPLVVAGVTMPVNLALFSKYGNVSNNTALQKKATKDACDALKAKYGNNLRIYIIKYKTGAENVSYLDTYATNNCLYSITTESQLKTTLQKIAKELKTWAGYTEAKVIE